MQIGVSSRGVTGLMIFNAMITTPVVIGFIVQISIIVGAKMRVNSIRMTNTSVVWHWGNTVRANTYPLDLPCVNIFLTVLSSL